MNSRINSYSFESDVGNCASARFNTSEMTMLYLLYGGIVRGGCDQSPDKPSAHGHGNAPVCQIVKIGTEQKCQYREGNYIHRAQTVEFFHKLPLE